jgi:5-methylcytosine-specific restriction enzyme subunit McrC
MKIYEYDEIKDPYLKSYIENTPSLYSYFKSDFKKIKAKQYCGILTHDNQDFYILPKIAKDENKNLKVFIYMFIYAYDLNIKNEDIASSLNNTSNNFFEVFIQMFAKNLIKEFQKGIYKKYITIQENITTLRGKYLINENLKYNFTKNKIYCEFDEFSEDNILNQFFLYAVKTLIPFVKNKKYLKMWELILEDV